MVKLRNLLKEFHRIFKVEIPRELSEYKKYKKRICHLCGMVVPRNEGKESYSSFIIYHDECFDKLINSYK